VVNLRPGQSPISISIAINEMLKRKSPALVAFHSDARLLGKEAARLIARYPEIEGKIEIETETEKEKSRP
jgi:hypoxia up-regulated 1